jgi:hypothetical protein
MKAGRVRLVWTTNFDPLVADGCARVFDGTGHLTTVTLETATLGREAINESRWPAEIKLHGDFRSRRLKNTNDELRQQDADLRQLLIDSCGRWGLIVCGYSGRDDSVMDALEAAFEQTAPFPGGLFWLQRGDGRPLPRVVQLLRKAATKNVDVGLVEVENFDEVLRDIVRLTEGLDTVALDAFASERKIWSPAPRPVGGRGFPVIRLNALEVTTTPSVCRRVVCSIGGHSEISAAVEASGADILATRTKQGVIAFGSDADVRKAFGGYGIKEFDLHPIERRRLRYDSQQRGLLRQGLSRALARKNEMTLNRRRSSDLLAPETAGHVRWTPVKELVGSIAGAVAGYPELSWREGLSIRLDWADERL